MTAWTSSKGVNQDLYALCALDPEREAVSQGISQAWELALVSAEASASVSVSALASASEQALAAAPVSVSGPLPVEGSGRPTSCASNSESLEHPVWLYPAQLSQSLPSARVRSSAAVRALAVTKEVGGWRPLQERQVQPVRRRSVPLRFHSSERRLRS